MMTENCDKYIEKAKYGLIVFSTALIVGILKKTQLIDRFFGDNLDIFFISWIVIAGVISLKLSMPYIDCLSKNKKR